MIFCHLQTLLSKIACFFAICGCLSVVFHTFYCHLQVLIGKIEGSFIICRFYKVQLHGNLLSADFIKIIFKIP